MRLRGQGGVGVQGRPRTRRKTQEQEEGKEPPPNQEDGQESLLPLGGGRLPGSGTCGHLSCSVGKLPESEIQR